VSEATGSDLATLTQRAQDWYAETTWRRAATLVELGPRAWGLLTPEWPKSYANNGIVLRTDPGPDTLLRWSEEVLGGAGLEHRYVMAFCQLSPTTRDALVAAGYDVQPEVTMVRPNSLGPLAPVDGVTVELVPEEVTVGLQQRMWVQEWQPGADAETVRQLVGRRITYPASGEFLSYVVREDGADDPVSGDLVACLDLCVRPPMAEVDGVATLTDHRRRRYGEALLATAIAASIERGCTVVVLTALADDWPQEWYARRGFVAIEPTWAATRVAPSV
jgi:ribosomal protein S18 acetylase RimI-like enzyme